MSRKPCLYLVLGVLATISLGAVTNQATPLPSVLEQGVALHSTGVEFPDGTLQTTAYGGNYGAPEQVFQDSCSVTQATATGFGNCDLATTVPAGKRLVIETVSGFGFTENFIMGSGVLTAGSFSHSFPMLNSESSSTGLRYLGFNHAVRLYVDGPATLEFDLMGGFTTGASPDYFIGYSVSGYLVDVIP